MPIFADLSDVEVDRDEDTMSPQPHSVQFNGKDGHYLELPSDVSAPPPVNVGLPGSPQKKMIQPIIEEEPTAQGELDSNNIAER